MSTLSARVCWMDELPGLRLSTLWLNEISEINFCVCLSHGLKLWLTARKRLYEFNMRVVKECSELTAGKRRNISSWMSTRLQITQSYKHNVERRGRNKQCSCRTKKSTKVCFYVEWQQATNGILQGHEGKENAAVKGVMHQLQPVQACVRSNRGWTSPIYLHVVSSGSLLLAGEDRAPPPVLADPTSRGHAVLAVPNLRG